MRLLELFFGLFQSLDNATHNMFFYPPDYIESERNKAWIINNLERKIEIIDGPETLIWPNKSKFVFDLNEKLELLKVSKIKGYRQYKSLAKEGQEINFIISQEGDKYISEMIEEGNTLSIFLSRTIGILERYISENMILRQYHLKNIKLNQSLINQEINQGLEINQVKIEELELLQNNMIKEDELIIQQIAEFERWKSFIIVDSGNSIIQLTKEFEPKNKYKLYKENFYKQIDGETANYAYARIARVINRIQNETQAIQNRLRTSAENEKNVRNLDRYNPWWAGRETYALKAISINALYARDFENVIYVSSHVEALMNLLCGEELEVLWIEVAAPLTKTERISSYANLLLSHRSQALPFYEICNELNFEYVAS